MSIAPERIVPARLDALRRRVAGRVLTPRDDGYESARLVFAGHVDARPAAIVRVRDASDVAEAVAFARDEGLELAVRSGGHSGAGHGTSDRGLVIDVRELASLEIDPVARTAWAGTGLTAGAVTRATGEHGLAVGFGDTGSVGIGGLTLGGGIGFLVRPLGLTIDSLLAAEIVTADGSVRVIDAETDPDLFWAIRGGGGNFGVATRFRYRLHDVATVVGGVLVLPATADTIEAFLAEAAAAPEQLSAIANVMPAPPLPFLDPEHHGRLVIMALIMCVGPVDAAERAVEPFRRLADPLADLLRPMRYPEIYAPDDESYRPKAISHTGFLDALDRRAAEAIVDRLEASDAPVRAAQLRVLGGAMARVAPDATAFAHRSAPMLASVAAFYEGPADRPAKAAWVEDLARTLHGDDDRAYVNFLGDEGEARVRAAYPGGTWQRLAAIKRRYDPDNVFRRNQNVPPA